MAAYRLHADDIIIFRSAQQDIYNYSLSAVIDDELMLLSKATYQTFTYAIGM